MTYKVLTQSVIYLPLYRDKTDDITMTISPSYNIANTSTTL